MTTMNAMRRCGLAACAALVVPVLAAASETKFEGIEFLAEMSVEGQRLVRFEADTDRGLGEDDVQRQAAKLAGEVDWQIDPNQMTKLDEHRLAIRHKEDPSASFEMDVRTGNFIFNGGLARYRKEHETEGLPRKGEGREMTIERLEGFGLLPEISELGEIHEGGLNMAVREKDGSTSIYRKLVTLRISRQLNGLPVMGDSRIVAHLGTGGRLAGLVYQWPKVAGQKLSAGELRGAEDLQAETEDRLRAGSEDAERAVITKARLVLYDDGRGVIEPAFHVEAQLYYETANQAGLGPDEVRYDVPLDFYVPATKAPRAFYPHMEKAPVAPTDARRRKLPEGDNE